MKTLSSGGKMKGSKVETKIKERFDELSDIFPESVEVSDSRIQAISRFFGDVNGKRILDAGCGKGRFSKVFLEMGAYVIGLDLSEKLLNETKEINNGSFLLGSVTNLPFNDKTFDLVFSIEVMEHVPDTDKTIREMVRVLKKNGRIVIIDKNKLSLSKYLVPNLLIKKYMEMRDKWMYPHNFPFTEKWFFSWEVDKTMKKYCRKTYIKYLQEDNGGLFKFLPFLNWFIAWEGIK